VVYDYIKQQTISKTLYFRRFLASLALVIRRLAGMLAIRKRTRRRRPRGIQRSAAL